MSEKNVKPITDNQKMDLLNGAVEAQATVKFNKYRKQLAEVSQVLDIARCTIFNIIDVISYKGSLDNNSRDLEQLSKIANNVLDELTEVVKSINVKIGDTYGKSDKE